jgi:hypothetical protein
VGAVIVHAVVQIHRDTFDIPAVGVPDPDCSSAIRRLHDAFDQGFQARQAGRPPPDTAGLDRDLRALRPVCDREGPSATAAYESLLRWRYQADSLSHAWSRGVALEAHRALGYVSPSSTHR